MWTEKEYKSIGFSGCDQLLLIAGCALRLQRGGKKILLMDYSKEGELKSVIPLPKELQDTKNVLLSYQSIDYMHADSTERVEDYGFEYDVVLANFGREIGHVGEAACDSMVYTTDMCCHNMKMLQTDKRRRGEVVVLKNYMPGKEEIKCDMEELIDSEDAYFVLPYKEQELLPFLFGESIDKVKERSFSKETRYLLTFLMEREMKL